MKVGIPAKAPGLDAAPNPIFGRSPYFVIVDSDTMEAETLSNPAAGSLGGAGVQTSQLLVSKGVEAVIASSVGPNASAVLQAADIAVYHCGSDVDTIRDAVLALRDERLELMSGPNVASHTGTRQRFGTGKARARNDEVASLTQEASELQQRLEEISNRLKDLEGTDD
ncbi:MAG: dinitrogenase iron-molybdenum cofactor biosynthesis protein [Anaerolineae bacterium]|nr:dinitrogenase iron-molybdenum cofactor biosynthesis protein [Anaerolineae bacterium]